MMLAQNPVIAELLRVVGLFLHRRATIGQLRRAYRAVLEQYDEIFHTVKT